jgi:integrase
MKPDRQTLRRLAVGERLVCGGVEAGRMKDGNIRYRLAFRCDGQRIHRVIGTERDGMSFAKAKAIAEQMRTDARHGRLNLPKARKTPLSFAEAAERYLAVLRASDGKNIDRKEMHLRAHLCPALGTQRLDTLDRFALQRYRKARGDEGASPSTINREMSTAAHLMSVAVAERWVEARPCSVPKTLEARKPRVLLSDSEVEALLRAAAEDPNPQVLIFIHFALGSAMRHREILAARFDQVDWQNCRLVIPDAKAGQRLQPISVELRDVLLRERELASDPTGWIFPARSPTGAHTPQMSDPFRRVVIRAGLNPRETTPHALRHLCITRVLQAGTDLRTAQAISGHKTLAMLLHYSHTSAPLVDKAMAALDRPNVTETSPSNVVPLAPPSSKQGKTLK